MKFIFKFAKVRAVLLKATLMRPSLPPAVVIFAMNDRHHSLSS